MAGRKWTKKENKYLKKYYSNKSFKDLERDLNRTKGAIIIQASKLNIKRCIVSTRIGDVSPLLSESCQAYYWIGFIAADGSILDYSRLKVALSIKDKDHLKKLSNFLGTNLNLYKTTCAISIQDKILIPKICKKFDFKKRKTYNPPGFIKCNGDLFLSFLAGFIDGDGSIPKLNKRKDVNLKIKIHYSWFGILKILENKLYKYFNTRHKNLTKINSTGYAELVISNNTLLRALKVKLLEINIPLMERKWNKIDEALVSREIKAQKKTVAIDALFKKGLSIKKISIKLSIPYATVYSHVKRLNYKNV